MNKRLILVLALALVVGLTAGAYAEVQNVKVSGDIYAAGVGRNNYDLTKSGNINNGANKEDKEADFLSIARLRVDADLTDNVSTTIRLLNERNWNGEGNTATGVGPAVNNANIGLNAANLSASDENGITLDLAYVTLKEFLYSPLTLKIGRQNLYFGNGLIVGDPDTNIYSSATRLAEGDLSARKSFDAVRVTLDYNPLVIDGIYGKLEEGSVNLNDDVTLFGLNAAYDLNKNTLLEGFFFSKIKGSQAAAVHNVDANNATSFVNKTAGAGVVRIKDEADKVNTIGARIVNKTVNNLSIDAQSAYQFGTYNPKFDPNAKFISATNFAKTTNRSAWALQVNANYDLKDVNAISKYAPVVSGGYTYLSGANRNKTGDGSYKGWDSMFEDQTQGHIINGIFANTNTHRALFGGKAKLTDDINLKLDYVSAWFAKKYVTDDLAVLSGVAGGTAAASGRLFRLNGKSFLGQEVDATVTYDYTEDVQFALLGGLFAPSRAIAGTTTAAGGGKTEVLKRATAVELIGSMKVTF